MADTAHFRADLGAAGVVEVAMPRQIPADEVEDLLAYLDLIKGQIRRRAVEESVWQGVYA